MRWVVVTDRQRIWGHALREMAQSIRVEQGENGVQSSTTWGSVQVVNGIDQLRSADMQRLANMSDQGPADQVGGCALDAILWNHDGSILLGQGVILRSHVVHPRHFASAVQIVRAGLCASRERGLAIFMERANSRDEHFGLLRQLCQVVLVELRDLNTRLHAVRVCDT